MRSRTNRRVDKKVFKKTASRTHVKNIPGRVISRGGTRL